MVDTSLHRYNQLTSGLWVYKDSEGRLVSGRGGGGRHLIAQVRLVIDAGHQDLLNGPSLVLKFSHIC